MYNITRFYVLAVHIFYCVKLHLSVKQNPVIPNINSGANAILYII